jgi:hypothetical protein
LAVVNLLGQIHGVLDDDVDGKGRDGSRASSMVLVEVFRVFLE